MSSPGFLARWACSVLCSQNNPSVLKLNRYALDGLYNPAWKSVYPIDTGIKQLRLPLNKERLFLASHDY